MDQINWTLDDREY